MADEHESAADALRGHLTALGLSPGEFGASLDPPVSHESVRAVLRGERVGAKVALSICRKLPGLTLEMLIDPEGTLQQKGPGAAA